MPRLAHIGPAPQLIELNSVTPGRRGINLQQQNSVLPADWAIDAQNCVIDSNGRMSARKGVVSVTGTPVGVPIKTIFEQHTALGAVTNIVAYDGGISTDVTNPGASLVTGAVTATNGRWFFQNFNNKAIGFQAGQKLIVRSTGNFATVVESHGTAPTGGVGLAAYGRIWQLDADGHTIKYSGLLDETCWDNSTGCGAGSLDMMNIWTQGTDEVRAIVAFNHNIVVFGLRHIVFFSDGGGSALGLDPTKIGVVDVIEGTGCISQWTVQHVGDADLIFLSPVGVQSLGRLLVQRSRPLSVLTKYVRDVLVTQITSETAANISSAYSPLYGFYVLSLPIAGQTWIVDQRRRYQDEDGDDVSPVTYWNFAPTAIFDTTAHVLYIAKTTGKIGTYSGVSDDNVAFRLIFSLPWLDFGDQVSQRLKILKRLGSLVLARNAQNLAFKWAVDFSPTTLSNSVTAMVAGSAEWGTAEFGIGEWSGGLLLQLLHIRASGTGQYFRFSIEADVLGDFAIQQTEIFAKVGRIA